MIAILVVHNYDDIDIQFHIVIVYVLYNTWAN